MPPISVEGAASKLVGTVYIAYPTILSTIAVEVFDFL